MRYTSTGIFDFIKDDNFSDAKMTGIAAYYNVCIEDLPTPIRMVNDGVAYNETKKIVIYDSRLRKENSTKINLSVKGYIFFPNFNHWPLEFSKNSLPYTHKFHPNTSTAFFAFLYCPANLHHFLIDDFRPLYAVVKRYGRLFENARNQLVYRIPHDIPGFQDKKNCFDINRFYPILKSLHIENTHDVFFRFPSNMCFQQAVFGIDFNGVGFKEPQQHILRYFNIGGFQNGSKKKVTIIYRSERRLININDMLHAVNQYSQFQGAIVDMKDLTIVDQVTLAYSTDILIGVQGAALEFSMFLKNGSHLIEIAWPHKYWYFYFKEYVSGYDIVHHEFVANEVHANWTSFCLRENRCNFTQKQKDNYLNAAPADKFINNIWKWADAKVNITSFKLLLDKIK